MKLLILGWTLVWSGWAAAAVPFTGFTQAHQLEQQGKYAEAISLLKDSVKQKQPDDIQGLALFYAGILAYNNNQFQEASADLQAALKLPIRLADYAHYYLAMSEFKLNDLKDAKTELTQIKNTPAGMAFNFETRMQLALIAIQQKNWRSASRALRQLERKSRHNDRYPEVLYHLIAVNQRLHNHRLACKWARKLFAKFPAYPLVADWDIELAKDRIEDQPVQCLASLKEKQSRVRHLQWAGEDERARKEIDVLEAKATDADRYAIDKTLAQFLVMDGYVDQALQIYLKYYDTEGKQIDYLLAVGEAAARAGEMQVAISAYYRAYHMHPRGKIGREALFQAAFLSYRFRDYDGSSRKFQELMHKFPRSKLSRDARWHLAWMRYLKGDYQGAYDHLDNLISMRRHNNNDKYRYWMAMSLYRMGKTDDARAEFESLAADNLIGYYAIAAQSRLAKMKVPTRRVASIQQPVPQPDTDTATPPEDESEESLQLQKADEPGAPPQVDDDSGDDDTDDTAAAPEEKIEPTDFADPKLVARFDRVKDLLTVGMNEWVKWELFEIERRTRNPQYLKMLMSQYEQNQAFYRSSFIAQTYFTRQRATEGLDPSVRALWEHTYPKAYQSQVIKSAHSFHVKPELIWGIMRAESQYRPDASSAVGALGLMQIMPFTARKVASILDITNFDPQQLFVPDTNIRLGARYLRRLMDKFARQIPLVAAAYNAGPQHVDEWLYSFGMLDMDEFIEHIPYVETRNYVKKVVRNYQIYRELYAKDKRPVADMAGAIRVQVQTPPSHREMWDTVPL